MKTDKRKQLKKVDVVYKRAPRRSMYRNKVPLKYPRWLNFGSSRPSVRKSYAKRPYTPKKSYRVCRICHYRNDSNLSFCGNCGRSFILKPKSEQGSSIRATEIVMPNDKAIRINDDIPDRCYSCGAAIDKSDDKCSYCGKGRRKCPICLQFLNYDDDTAYCFYCETDFHFPHLMEFVKIKGFCPVCKKKLLSTEAVRRYQHSKKKL